MLLVLAVAAAFSVLASDMPRIAARPLALATLAWGGWRAWRETRQSRYAIVVMPDATSVDVDGKPVQAFALRWRGPLALLQWRDGEGRLLRRTFWPDTLPAARRRELRLAAPPPAPARAPASVAP